MTAVLYLMRLRNADSREDRRKIAVEARDIPLVIALDSLPEEG